MVPDRFDALTTVVGRGATRRRLLRGVLGSALAGAGLVRVGADTAAISGKRCCKKQKRNFRESKQACLAEGGLFPFTFSCERATCDPNVEIVFDCVH